MRDRLIALSMRKPLGIKYNDYDIPMLVLNDFNVQPYPSKLVELLGGFAADDVAKRTDLARLCIEKI